MISCKEVVAGLSDYLDNDMSPDIRRELEAHLAECRTCEVIYDSMHKSVRLVTETRSFDLSEGASARLLAKIRANLQSDTELPDPEDS